MASEIRLRMGVVLKKILFDGGENTGKSSIVTRLSDNLYADTYIPTMGVEFRFIQHGNVKLQIWDVAGQERFRANPETYYTAADVVLYVFDLTNKASFDRLDTIIPVAQKACSAETIHYLIGNKSDTEHRAVTYHDMDNLTVKYNLSGYFHVSAKSGEGIEHIRNILVGLNAPEPL